MNEQFLENKKEFNFTVREFQPIAARPAQPHAPAHPRAQAATWAWAGNSASRPIPPGPILARALLAVDPDLRASKARPAAPPETLDHFSACFLSQCRERQRRWRPRRTPAAVAVPRLLPPASLSLSPFSPFFLCLHRPRTSSSEEDGDGAAVKFLAGARARPWLSTPPSSSLATVPCWPDLGELSPPPAVLFPFLFPPARRRVRRRGEPSHPLPLLSPFGFFDSDFARFPD